MKFFRWNDLVEYMHTSNSSNVNKKEQIYEYLWINAFTQLTNNKCNIEGKAHCSDAWEKCSKILMNWLWTFKNEKGNIIRPIIFVAMVFSFWLLFFCFKSFDHFGFGIGFFVVCSKLWNGAGERWKSGDEFKL